MSGPSDHVALEGLVALLANECGLSPADHAGILRAFKARDGAAGELMDIAVALGKTPCHRPRGEVLEVVRMLGSAFEQLKGGPVR